ncbi:hypothetical protein ETB97_003241 [Aspergillus alliaceus]|uniref:Uncharacterized protein n=1 Tax=Petromyces alliaceus TaxID=209559 RepID=A0A8H6A1C5_PETAA|nr:hypothetical protein ETB97_003241 [Aspergillus burnettii]
MVYRYSLLRPKSVLSFIASLAFCESTFLDCSASPLSENGVCDTSLDRISQARSPVEAKTPEEKINNTRYDSPGVSRLGLPAYNWWNEVLHGVTKKHGVSSSDSGNYR